MTWASVWHTVPIVPSANLRFGRQLGWVKETFKNRALAEHALNDEYIDFKGRTNIMEYVPPATRALISRNEPEARVRGFRELFGHLDEEVGRIALRSLVVDFFANSTLAEHLGEPPPILFVIFYNIPCFLTL